MKNVLLPYRMTDGLESHGSHTSHMSLEKTSDFCFQLKKYTLNQFYLKRKTGF